VKVVPDRETEQWLLSGPSFQWDAGNQTKSEKKHGITTDEAESIYLQPIVFGGLIVEPAHNEARWIMFGVTETGRHMTIVFTRRGNELRPISCRAMRVKEAAAYEARIGS
jgi:uncharacterized DUF497 family protein